MNSTAFVWAIITACVWGVVPLFEKAGLAKAEPLVGLFYRCIGVVLGVLILGTIILKKDAIRSIDPKAALYLIIGGFLASFVAQIAFYHSLKVGEISRVVPISGAYPLVTFLLGVLLFHEAFSVSKAIGVLLVIAGTWCIKGI